MNSHRRRSSIYVISADNSTPAVPVTTGTVTSFSSRILRSAPFKRFFQLADKPPRAPSSKRPQIYTASDSNSSDTSRRPTSSEPSEVVSTESISNLTTDLKRLSIDPHTSSPIADVSPLQNSRDQDVQSPSLGRPFHGQPLALSSVYAASSLSTSSLLNVSTAPLLSVNCQPTKLNKPVNSL